MPRLPPVDMSPQTRLRARFWPGVIPSVTTFFQSHSSSSATSWARPVSVPCPISERAMRITQVSSGRITTQALTSVSPGAALCATALPTPNGTLNPSARPPPAAAAEPTMNLRRESVTALLRIVLFMADLLAPSLWTRRERCRRFASCRPPDARPHGCADRCRIGRCWSSLRRCRRRSASDSS